jgi:DNA ligase 1
MSCPHISKALKPFFEEHPDWIIDGEIYSHDEKFEKIISLVKKSKPTQEDLIESEKLVKLWIFDGTMENEEWNFVNRFNLIKEEVKKLSDIKYLKFVENEEVNNHAEVQEAHDKYVAEGYEGVMVRIPNSMYENKRSKYLLKYKEFMDEEFVIKEVVEGSGNRSGMAGKLIVIDKNGNEFGAGIKGGEDYYKELLEKKDELVGKLATIRYQNLSEDGIPRFPVAINIAPIDR